MGAQGDAGRTGALPPMSFGETAQKIWRMTDSGASWMKAPLWLIAGLLVAAAWVVVAVVNAVWAVFVLPVKRLRSRRRAVEDIGSPMHGVKHRQIP